MSSGINTKVSNFCPPAPSRILFPQPLSHGNVLSFRPPGFNQVLNVKFPDCRLPVCEKCKKNYKTRDMCRVRNNHTDPPWSTAYIAITLDKSCTDPNNKYLEKPFNVRMTQWEPYCTKKPFDSKTPVCAACKKTNRTRSFCRERHQHKQLPWCTVYVVLSADEDAKDEETEKPTEATLTPDEDKQKIKEDIKKETVPVAELVTDEIKVEENGSESGPSGNGALNDKPNWQPVEGSENDESDTDNAAAGTAEESTVDLEDDIDKIDDTRTFLCQISCKKSSIQWLELADADTMKNSIFGPAGNLTLNGTAGNLGVMVGMPGRMNTAQYYTAIASTPGFAQHQQQQRALKMQQQHFFEMQQRQQQQFVAQQVALQAQYNQQVQMVMSTGQQVAATPGVVVPQAQLVPGTAIQQAAPVPSPGPLVAMTPMQMLSPPQQLLAAPVAAAVPQAPPAAAAATPVGTTPTPDVKQEGAATSVATTTDPAKQAAQAQAAQAQWHMMYQQQLYQMQMQQQAGRATPIMIQPAGAMMSPQFIPGAVPVQQAVASPQFQQFPQMQFNPQMIAAHQSLHAGANMMAIQPIQQSATTPVTVVANQDTKIADDNGKRKLEEIEADTTYISNDDAKKVKIETV